MTFRKISDLRYVMFFVIIYHRTNSSVHRCRGIRVCRTLLIRENQPTEIIRSIGERRDVIRESGGGGGGGGVK